MYYCGTQTMRIEDRWIEVPVFEESILENPEIAMEANQLGFLIQHSHYLVIMGDSYIDDYFDESIFAHDHQMDESEEWINDRYCDDNRITGQVLFIDEFGVYHGAIGTQTYYDDLDDFDDTVINLREYRNFF